MICHYCDREIISDEPGFGYWLNPTRGITPFHNECIEIAEGIILIAESTNGYNI